MILKIHSHIELIGEVSQDLVSRIQERVMHSLKHYKIVYDNESIMISWSDSLSAIEYFNLTEDISCLFNSLNIPAFIHDEPVIGKELADEWEDIIKEYYGYCD